jgi:group I intron endonuclease
MNAQLKRGKSAICSSILKHGHSIFRLEILEYCEPDNAVTREQHYLDLLKPEYNILGTAGSPLGFLHSVESIAKMSEAKKGNKNRLGKNHSELAKGKMSAAHIGKILSDKTKAKLSEIKKGENNPLFGKTHSEETKNKMSEALGTAIKVLDLETNETSTFSSITKAAKSIGVDHGLLTYRFKKINKTSCFVFKGRYQIEKL